MGTEANRVERTSIVISLLQVSLEAAGIFAPKSEWNREQLFFTPTLMASSMWGRSSPSRSLNVDIISTTPPSELAGPCVVVDVVAGILCSYIEDWQRRGILETQTLLIKHHVCSDAASEMKLLTDAANRSDSSSLTTVIVPSIVLAIGVALAFSYYFSSCMIPPPTSLEALN